MATTYKHIDYDFDDFSGTDAGLDISMLEYGLAWTGPDADGDYLFRYAVVWDSKGDTTAYHSGRFSADCDIWAEFDWIKPDNRASFLAFLGMSQEDFDAQALPYRIADLLRYYGHLNIFGEAYYEPIRLVHSDSPIADLLAWAEQSEGFRDFLNGYLLGLAFTGHRYPSEEEWQDGNPLPLVDCPGMDITDCVDPSEVWGWIPEDNQREALGDCVAFFREYHTLFTGREESAGTDFHLTRNGHGAGFWDGDWQEEIGPEMPWQEGREIGDILTEGAKQFGAFELEMQGDSYYIVN